MQDKEAHNQQQRQRAINALARIIDDALHQGDVNAVTIRCPINHGKLGNIREIIERDAAK